MRDPARLLGVLLAVSLAGCVSVDWTRAHRDDRIAWREVRALEPGVADLTRCLERLGAPLLVFEEPGGAALAWGWLEAEARGISVSVPISESVSASLDLRELDEQLEGIVLFFDGDWVLRFARRGKLVETIRRRPSMTEA